MPIRSSMQGLVDHVRRVIGDTATTETFRDEDIQAALDERRSDISAAMLTGDSALDGSPTIFRAMGAWEANAVITDNVGTVLTPDGPSTDVAAGVFAFTASPGEAVYLTGRTYDVWGAAANLLEMWAARVALEFDFGTDQQSFNRTGKRKNLLAVAREYGRRAITPGSRSW